MNIKIKKDLVNEAIKYSKLSRSHTSDTHDFHEGGLNAKQRKMFEGKLGEKGIKQFFIDNNINIPFLEDTDVTGKKYGVKGIPTIFVIDKFGIIQLIRVGYTKEEEEEDFVSDLSEIIDKLLSDK